MNTLSSLLNWIGGFIGANPNTLTTGDKTIVGAINEVKANAITNASVTETGEANKLPKITAEQLLKVKKLEIDSNEVKDCVIAQEVSGDWMYRKWSSGFLEQLGRVTVNANSGAVAATFPQAFKDTAFRVFATGGYKSGQPAYAESVQITSVSTANVYIRNAAGTTPTIQTTVDIYAAGYWK